MILDSIDDIDFIEPLRLNMTDVFYREDDGLIMLERESQSIMISMTDIDKFKRLWSQCHLDQYQLYNVNKKKLLIY